MSPKRIKNRRLPYFYVFVFFRMAKFCFHPQKCVFIVYEGVERYSHGTINSHGTPFSLSHTPPLPPQHNFSGSARIGLKHIGIDSSDDFRSKKCVLENCLGNLYVLTFFTSNAPHSSENQSLCNMCPSEIHLVKKIKVGVV